MSWDPVWDTLFEVSDFRSYPSEDLIRFVARHFYGVPHRDRVRILEVGCGTGANVWYLAREGFAAFGIDGSRHGIERAREKLARDALVADLRVGDIATLTDEYGAASFDAVVDIGALQSNRMVAIETMLDQIETVVRPGGWIFADLIATGTSGEGRGTELEPGTYEAVGSGLLEGKGVQHFFTREELGRLFGRFDALEINEWSRTIEHGTLVYRHWVVEAQRPA